MVASQQSLFPYTIADCRVMPAVTLASLVELGGLADGMSHMVPSSPQPHRVTHVGNRSGS